MAFCNGADGAEGGYYPTSMSMNGQDIYDFLKEALRFFDLDWSEKEKIKVFLGTYEIRIEYQDKAITRRYK